MLVQLQTLPNQPVPHGRGIICGMLGCSRRARRRASERRSFPPVLKNAIDAFRQQDYQAAYQYLERFQTAQASRRELDSKGNPLGRHEQDLLAEILLGSCHMLQVLDEDLHPSLLTKESTKAVTHYELALQQFPKHSFLQKLKHSMSFSNIYYNLKGDIHEYCALAYMHLNREDLAKQHLEEAQKCRDARTGNPAVHQDHTRTKPSILEKKRFPYQEYSRRHLSQIWQNAIFKPDLFNNIR